MAHVVGGLALQADGAPPSAPLHRLACLDEALRLLGRQLRPCPALPPEQNLRRARPEVQGAVEFLVALSGGVGRGEVAGKGHKGKGKDMNGEGKGAFSKGKGKNREELQPAVCAGRGGMGGMGGMGGRGGTGGMESGMGGRGVIHNTAMDSSAAAAAHERSEGGGLEGSSGASATLLPLRCPRPSPGGPMVFYIGDAEADESVEEQSVEDEFEESEDEGEAMLREVRAACDAVKGKGKNKGKGKGNGK